MLTFQCLLLKQFTASQRKSMVNVQAGRLIFLLTCEIRLQLSEIFCYSKHQTLFTVKQRFEVGPVH